MDFERCNLPGSNLLFFGCLFETLWLTDKTFFFSFFFFLVFNGFKGVWFGVRRRLVYVFREGYRWGRVKCQERRIFVHTLK